MPQTLNALERTVFLTELGWMSLVMSGDRVVHLTFGHSSRDGAARTSKRAFGISHSLSRRAFAAACESAPEGPLVERLVAYARGKREDFSDVAIDHGPQTAFQKRVIERCRQIKFGQTLTYGQLAAGAGSPRAARAVGNIMACNRVPLLVPCHRVVASGGGLGGYSAPGGTSVKQKLLELESLVPVTAALRRAK